MKAATLIKLGNEAGAGDCKEKHALILAFCTPVMGITCSGSSIIGLGTRLTGRTGLNDRAIDDSLSKGSSDRKCRFIYTGFIVRLGDKCDDIPIFCGINCFDFVKHSESGPGGGWCRQVISWRRQRNINLKTRN